MTVLCGGVSDADPFSGFGQGADIQREPVRMRLAEGPNGICEAGLGKAPGRPAGLKEAQEQKDSDEMQETSHSPSCARK